MRRFAAALALAALLAAGSRAAVLERVEVVGGEAPAVRLVLSAPATAAAQRLGGTGDARRRLYLDLPATRGRGVPALVKGTGPLLRVRLGQFDARTLRVVLDLARDVPASVDTADRTITVSLAATPAEEVEEPPAAPGPTDATPAVAPRAHPVPEPPVAAPAPRETEPSGVAPVAAAPDAPAAAAPPEEPLPPAVAMAHAPGPPAAADVPQEPASPSDAEARPDTGPPANDGSRADVGPANLEPPAGSVASPGPERLADVARPSGAPAPATSAPAAEPEAARPVEAATPLIVIDPGHGGHDPGAPGVGGIVEKDVVLAIARRLAAKLTERLPVSVLLTRSDDSYVPIERRLAAAPATAVLFLSLHANACDTPEPRGLEVFYGGGAVQPASTGGTSRLAALLGRSLGGSLAAGVGGVRGEARPGSFAVLTRNAVPGALVEIGYLTHPGDAARACDASYQDMLADALVEGIGRFLRDSAPRL